ncbi:MAG: response regulator, partial [Bdellovibrionota bacterium]
MAHILIVDDDHDIRELVRALLTLSSHEVFLADGAINALQVLRREKIDVLITDANMPNFSGFDLLKMVKLEGLDNLAIVMLTGRREKADIKLAIEHGVHDYIVKPLNPDTFVNKITALLENRPVPDEYDEDDFPSARLISKARATMAIDVRTISELGLVARTNYELKPGSLLHVECDIFKEIGIPSVEGRVFLCQEKEGQWESRLSFVSLDPIFGKKIRS